MIGRIKRLVNTGLEIKYAVLLIVVLLAVGLAACTSDSSNISSNGNGNDDKQLSIESLRERYYLYFKEHSRHVNPLFSFPDSDENRLNSNLMTFAIMNVDNYSYENGNAKSEIDALLIKYFGHTVTSYNTNSSEVMPSGCVRATGWSYHGANRLVLTKLTDNTDGSYTGHFDVYYLPESPEDLDDLGGYDTVDAALQCGKTDGLERLHSESIVTNFNEINDETEPQGFYIRFNSIEFVNYTSVSDTNDGSNIKPDPVYDPTSYLSNEEMITSDGVKLTMTYDEVIAIIGEPYETFDNSDDVKSLIKNGYYYGFCQIGDSFEEDYPLPRDGEYYLLSISASESCTDPLPRGIHIGDTIEDVMKKFPTQDKTLKKWASQMVYGKQELGQPRAFLEYTTVLESYRIYVTTTTQVLNIQFDKQNKVKSVELIFEKG